MYSNNKLIRDVADIAAQIMSGKQPVTEKLHPNQQQLDVHEPEKDELTADDFKKLRGKKEVKKEEVEAIDEVKLADLPSRKIQGRAYGASRPEPHAVDTIKGPNDAELKKIEAEKKKKKFSEMVNLYQDKGLKSLSEMLAKEESTEDEFNKELDDAKEKNAGKKKNDEIAKGKVDAVKQEEVEQIDELSKTTLGNYYNAAKQDNKDHADSRRSGDKDEAKWAKDRMVKRTTGMGAAKNRLNKEEVEELDEREMTDAEMKKRETIVKSMKKGLSGFKERYGKDAKSVMYATATARAKGE
jgi:hypothetical protein